MRVLQLAALSLLFVAPAAADEVDIAALAAGLDSDDFQQRERSEEALVERGRAIIEKAVDVPLPPEGAASDVVEAHFAKLNEQLQAALKRGLDDHLQALPSPEARYRADKVRQAVRKEADRQLGLARGRYPLLLPVDEFDRVHGYTGGFRDDKPWFDAQFHNNSHHTVTSIRILVRITDKKSGVSKERVVTLGSGEKPIPPGGKVTWSSEVGMTRTSDHNFYWETLAVYGTR